MEKYVNEIVQCVPIILSLILPGVMLLKTVEHISSIQIAKYDKDDKKTFYIFCVTYSYIIYYIVYFLANKMQTRDDVVRLISIIVSIVFSIAFGIIIGFVLKNKDTTKFLYNTTGKALTKDVIHEMFSTGEGRRVFLYLKDKNYYINGTFRRMDTKDADNWIVISKWTEISVDKDEEIDNFWEDGKHDAKLLIRLDDVERIIVCTPNKNENDNTKDSL